MKRLVTVSNGHTSVCLRVFTTPPAQVASDALLHASEMASLTGLALARLVSPHCSLGARPNLVGRPAFFQRVPSPISHLMIS